MPTVIPVTFNYVSNDESKVLETQESDDPMNKSGDETS